MLETRSEEAWEETKVRGKNKKTKQNTFWLHRRWTAEKDRPLCRGAEEAQSPKGNKRCSKDDDFQGHPSSRDPVGVTQSSRDPVGVCHSMTPAGKNSKSSSLNFGLLKSFQHECLESQRSWWRWKLLISLNVHLSSRGCVIRASPGF